jgi:hypothetical protein
MTLGGVMAVGCGMGAGCSTGSGGEPDPGAVDAPVSGADASGPALVSLAVTPPSLALLAGESRQLAVTGTYEDGSSAPVNAGLVWSSSAPALVAVDETGLATATAAGDATITARAGALHADVAATITGALRGVFGDDYADGVSYAAFGGSVNGPSLVGTDTHSGATCLRIDVPAAGYTGGAFRLDAPADLSGFDAVTFWARASKVATLNVVGIGNDASAAVLGAEWNGVPLTTAWTRFIIPVPAPARFTAERGLFHVAEGADEGAYTLWIDDVRYEVLATGTVGAPSPAIATETVARPVGTVFPLNGAAITYPVGSGHQTIAVTRRYFAYTSSNPAVATVDVDGQVTAVAVGSTTITARFGTIDAIGALTFNVVAAAN